MSFHFNLQASIALKSARELPLTYVYLFHHYLSLTTFLIKLSDDWVFILKHVFILRPNLSLLFLCALILKILFYSLLKSYWLLYCFLENSFSYFYLIKLIDQIYQFTLFFSLHHYYFQIFMISSSKHDDFFVQYLAFTNQKAVNYPESLDYFSLVTLFIIF